MVVNRKTGMLQVMWQACIFKEQLWVRERERGVGGREKESENENHGNKDSWTLTAILSNTTPPTVPYLPKLPTEFQELQSNHWKIWGYEDHFTSNYHISLPTYHEFRAIWSSKIHFFQSEKSLTFMSNPHSLKSVVQNCFRDSRQSSNCIITLWN